MKPAIQAYLTETRVQLQRSKDLVARFALPAIHRLMMSDAYAVSDHVQLKVLAADLKSINFAEIQLAKKYPDVFHPHVILSREEENKIYDVVIALVEKQPSKAA